MLGSQAAVTHLFNHIRCFLLPAPIPDRDRKIGKKALYSLDEKSFKYTKVTAADIGYE